MTDEAWERLAGAVRVRRRSLGLTQAGLAAEVGVSEPTIRVIETARRTSYKPSTLRDLALALHWTSDSVYRILAGDEPVEIAKGAPNYDERLARLERELADLRAELGLRPRRPNGGSEPRSA